MNSRDASPSMQYCCPDPETSNVIPVDHDTRGLRMKIKCLFVG